MPFTTIEWHQRFMQQRRWTRAMRAFLFEQLELNQAQRVLEVGCGTGAILQEIELQARFEGKSFGLDLNEDFLHFTTQQLTNTRLVAGDGYQLPFPAQTFDLVHCHFLLLWVREAAQIVWEMQRITRSGGWVVAFAEPDYGGRIDFPPELAMLGNRQEVALSQQGADTRVGRRLRGIWAGAGLAEIECGVVGGQWKNAPDEADIELEWNTLRHDLQNQLEPRDLDRLEEIDREAWQAGTRVLFVPTFYVCGKKT